MPSSSSQVPALKVPDPPRVDLGFPLRHSARAQQTAGEVAKGMYVAGAAQGYSLGTAHGYAAGHAVGTGEACVLVSACYGLITFASLVGYLAIRRMLGRRDGP